MGGTSSLGGELAEDTWEDELRRSELGHRTEERTEEGERQLERRRIAELLSRFAGGDGEVLEVLGLNLDDRGRGFILTAELQPATQRLIDRLGCRHPETLQRVSQVYASVARRESLSLTELKGYVACVLTQILRELDAGCAEVQPEPSELQRLMQELSSLNQSLDRRGCDLEEVEETRAKEGSQGADGADGGADKADEGAEQLRLLRKELDALSLSLRSDPRESPGTSAWAPAEPASAEPASEPVFEARPWRADALPKPLEREVPEVPCGPCGLARFAAGAEPEVAAPAQRDMRSLGSYPPGAVIDPGNTYARALRHAQRPSQPGAEPGSSVEGCAAVLTQPPRDAMASTCEPDHAVLRPMADGWQSRLKGASKGIAHGWQAFAETMDGIFVPEAGVDAAIAEVEEHVEEFKGDQGQGPHLSDEHHDVPSIFRQPSVEEVRELLEQEGLPAHVGIASAGCFCLKKLCLDRSSQPSLYVLDCESSVPALFLGMQGFGLHQLRRVVLGTAPSAKPLLSLEFDEGFLPVRLGSATVLFGVLGVLCEGRQVQILQQPDWS
ncbi:hypothetical protein AK812_SmicGene4497 [Symbiodinium microadriaticum]|uniref:Uncharacterized protein n=1 Tax=Symbiodinium microadriaticum TaxID=2951 RepID=A0A1Q9EW21_SYMMI|nr:hypothetical protein AK812_SmicGene4497 [Symbiodinium microadriaticum]CAE7220840.1 unnamed protein product [Symbiodinium sp. KB8]CAE7909909.1 unnamed protein product [Symbiodinium microadriaticum]